MAEKQSAARSGPAPRRLLTLVSVLPYVVLAGSIVSTVALLSTMRAVVREQRQQPNPVDALVIPPGHEKEIFALVVHGADAEIADADRPPIEQIQANGAAIVITFKDHPQQQLQIVPAANAVAPFVATDVIGASWSSEHVPPAVARYVSVIVRQSGWANLWREVAPDRLIDRMLMGLPRNWGALAAALIIGNAIAALLLLTSAARGLPSARPAPPDRAAAARNAAGLATVMTIAAVGVALAALAHFHFRMDDYPFLARAAHALSEALGQTRLLSTVVHFRIGVQLGGGFFWFAAANLVALATLCICWTILLRRLGFSFEAAVLAGALQGVGPGTFFLLRSANGIEHLSATACLMLILLVIDLAAREKNRPRAWHYGLLILALCLSLLGVLIKLPLMVVVPPSCWLWGRWMVTSPAPPFDRSATYGSFAIVVGGTIALLTLTPEAPIAFNPSFDALAAMGDRLWRYALVIVVVVVLGTLLRRASASADPGALSLIAQSVTARVGVLPLWVWAPLQTILWFTPFALHGGYAGEAYYGMLAFAPLSALAALTICTALTAIPTLRLRHAAAVVMCGALLPLNEIRGEMKRAANEHVPAWLDSVRVQTAAQPRPDRIVVMPACAPAPFAASLTDEMDLVFRETGIWWATGWYDVPTDFHDEALTAEELSDLSGRAVILGYCPGREATVHHPDQTLPGGLSLGCDQKTGDYRLA